MFEKWAIRCPSFCTYANPQKKGHFPRKTVKKKAHCGRLENSETTEIDKFGILALKLTEIRKLQLLRWIREEAGQCRSFVRVSKSQVSARMARISGKNANLCRKRSVALLFRLSSHSVWKNTRDGALTSFTVRVRTFGHFASGRVPYKSWFGGSLTWLNPLLHSQEAQILTQIHCVLLFFGLTLV